MKEKITAFSAEQKKQASTIEAKRAEQISAVEAKLPAKIRACLPKPRRRQGILEKFKLSVNDVLDKGFNGLLQLVGTRYALLIFLAVVGAGIKKATSQTTANDQGTINYQNIHCVFDAGYGGTGQADKQAMMNNLLPAIQNGYENNDIRPHDMQLVWQVDLSDAPTLVTANNNYTDINNFVAWYLVNGDNRDFQVAFYSTMAYEAWSANGASTGGWCRTVVGGGSDNILVFSHELPHTQNALDGDHNQAATDMTWQYDWSGWITNYNGESMGAPNVGGGAYLNGIYSTPVEYNMNSTANGGDGYRHFDYWGYPARVAVAEMDINNTYTNVTQGIVDFYEEYDWKIRRTPLADMGLTVEDVAPTPQVAMNGNSVSLSNSSAYDVTFPVTTNPAYHDVYNIAGIHEIYVYNADNPADGAQIAGPYSISEAITITADGDYVLRDFERRSNTLGAPSAVFSIDGVPPTGNITSDVETITNLPEFEVTFNFSEPIDPATFTQNDISKTNCDLSNLVINGDQATITVAPGNDGEVSLWVTANKFKDLAGNWNTAIDPWSIIFDGTGSAVNFDTPENPTNENPIPFTMTITEANGISGLGENDINANGGTIINWNYSGGNSATFDLQTDGTNGGYSVWTDDGAFADDAGNNSQAGNIDGELDYEAPYSADGFECAVGELTRWNSFPMSIQFNEALVDFDASKLNKNNCTVSNFQNNGNGNYSWHVNPQGDGLVSVSMDANVCHDFLPGGNGNVIVPAWNTTFDGTATTGEMTSDEVSPTNSNNIQVEGNISEEAVGFDASDFDVDNGSLTNITFNGQTFSFDIIPAGDGLITVTVPAGSFTDAAGNPNEEFWFTIMSDQTAPQLDITFDENSPTNADPIHINFNISETANLNANDISVTGGNLVNFTGSGDSYSAEIEPDGDGEVKTIVYNYLDPAGNVGISDTASIESDRTPPQLTIDGPQVINNGEDAAMTYNCTEPIFGFDNSDIESDNGYSTNFAGNGDFYTSTITDAGAGQSHVSVTGEYHDEAGNLGLEVEDFTIDILVGISEAPEINGVNVFPNPARNLINIETGEPIRDIVIYTIVGQEVIQQDFPGGTSPGSDRITIDVSTLPKGMYILYITSEDGHVSTKKIIKK